MPRITPGFRSRALTIAALLAAYPQFSHGATQTTYIGPNNGAWSVPANWSNGLPNSNAFDVVINSPVAKTVVLDASETINNFSLSAPNTLSLLTTLGASGNSFINSGTIVFNATGFSPTLFIGANLSLSGGGTILMSSSSSIITGSARLVTDNIISGSGTLGLGGLRITNSGTITASKGRLELGPLSSTDSFTNTGLLLAINKSTMAFGYFGSKIGYENTGGTMLAVGSSQMYTSGALSTIKGGQILSQQGSSVFEDGRTDFSNVTMSASDFSIIGARNASSSFLQTDSSSKFYLAGTITNSWLSGNFYPIGSPRLKNSFLKNGTSLTLGAVNVSEQLTFEHATLAAANRITVDNSSAFTGTGVIIFNGSSSSLRTSVTSLSIPATFMVRASDFGDAIVENDGVTINNQGTISSDTPNSAISLGATAQPGTFNNYGTVRAINGGIVLIHGAINNLGTISNAGGILAIDVPNPTLASFAPYTNQGIMAFALNTVTNTGSTMNLSAATTGAVGLYGATILGGALSSSDHTPLHIIQKITPTISSKGAIAGTLDGVVVYTDVVVHERGTLSIKNGATLNNVVITLGGTGESDQETETSLNFVDEMPLMGSGTIVLNSERSFIGPSSFYTNFTLDSGIVVMSGATGGKISPKGFLQGTILSNTPGKTISLGGLVSFPPLTAAGIVTNSGTISALNGGGLSFGSGNGTASGVGTHNHGLISANDAKVTFTDSLTNSATGLVTLVNSTFSFNNNPLLFNAGVIVATSSQFYLSGTLANSGTISLLDTALILKSFYNPNSTIGNFSHTGPTVFAATLSSGQVDLSNTVFGPSDLGGASVSFANISASSTIPSLRADYGTLQLSSATVTMGMLMLPGSILSGKSAASSFTLNGSITMLSSPSTSTTLRMNVIDGKGEIILGGQDSNNYLYSENSVVTFNSGILLRTGSGGGTVAQSSGVINNGTISAETSGQSITFGPMSFKGITNAGLMQVKNGGSISIQGILINSGRFSIDSASARINTGPGGPGGNNALSNSGIIALSNASLYTIYLSGGFNSGTISAHQSTIVFEGEAASSRYNFTNSGYMLASVGSTINFQPAPNKKYNFINTGILSADGGLMNFSGGTLTLGGVIRAINGGSFNFSSDKLTATSPIVLSNGNITINSTASSIAAISGIGGVVVGVKGIVASDGITVTSLSISGDHKIRKNGSDSGTSKLSSFSLAASDNGFTAVLDVNDNKFILQSDPALAGDKAGKVSYLQAAMLSGFNGGDYLGNGITSGTVAVDQSATGSHLTTLALFDNAVLNLASFGGQGVDTNSLLIGTALIGDTNLDQVVDGADFGNWYAHALERSPYTDDGDFNHDGGVDGLDFDLWFHAAGGGAQGVLDGLGVNGAAMSALRAPAAVPEAGTAGLVLVVVPWLLRRRRGR